MRPPTLHAEVRAERSRGRIVNDHSLRVGGRKVPHATDLDVEVHVEELRELLAKHCIASPGRYFLFRPWLSEHEQVIRDRLARRLRRAA